MVEPAGRREWSTLVDPGRPVDLVVQRLTGITPERLSGAARPADALRTFRTFVGDIPLVAHNAPFDLDFVATGLRRHRLPPLRQPVYDTLELARLLDPAAPSHRLADLVASRGLAMGPAHDALADAAAAADLFAALCGELGALDARLQRTLAHLLAGAPGPVARLVLSFAGAAVPGRVDRDLPPVPARERQGRRGTADPGRLLEPGSPLAERLRPFEVRPGQARMLSAVSAALAAGRHLIVEAGTGTGKSLAYLLPALAFAAERGEPIVVATGTVNLQEQLVHKDLPLITASGALEGEVALLKGRGQYACLRLWDERLEQPAVGREAAFLARFASWLSRTETGDRAELGVYGEDEEHWAGLSADAVACTARHCPRFEGCFLFRARRRAERADIVVVSHALLFADIQSQGGILPEYRHLICDEAHHLEDEASAHLGRVVGERAIERFWRLLDRQTPGGRRAGVLPTLRGRYAAGPLASPGVPGSDAAAAALDAAAAALEAGRAAAQSCFDGLRAWGEARARRGGARFEPRRPEGADPAWDGVCRAGAALEEALTGLSRALQAAADALESAEEDVSAGDVLQLQTCAGRAGEFGTDLSLCLKGLDGWVTWCEVAQTRSGSAGAVVVRASPIDPGGLLQRLLFEPKRSVVMTSATLAVGGRFDYLRSRLGLDAGPQAERADTLRVESPFDYRAQALLGVATDLPPPSRGREDLAGYADALAGPLLQLLRHSRGHALVLCTSHRTLQALRERLKPDLEAAGIACLAQGVDGSRSGLTAELRREAETVVLGSASFWEGVDLPGAALRCLIIPQLPFWPPDMPLQQARQESVEARGGNAFRDLQLPQAVLRFQQGFGRLIRAAGDRGVALVCDPRLASAGYGRAFLASLPGPTLAVGPAAEVVAQAASWLG